MNLPNKLTLLRILQFSFLLLLLPIGENKLLLPIPMQAGRNSSYTGVYIGCSYRPAGWSWKRHM